MFVSVCSLQVSTLLWSTMDAHRVALSVTVFYETFPQTTEGSHQIPEAQRHDWGLLAGPQVSWLAFVFLGDKKKLESLSTASEEPWYRNWRTILLIQFFLSLSLVTWWWYKLMKKSVSICLISRENSSELLTESMERIAFSLKNRVVCWSQWGPKPHEFT